MSEIMSTPRTREAGLIRPLDGLVHAVENKPAGNVAACGAGRIETQLVGQFDPDAPDTCHDCARAVDPSDDGGGQVR